MKKIAAMSLIPGDYIYGWTDKTNCPKDHVPAAQYFTLVSNNINSTFIMLTCVPEDSYIGKDPEKKRQDDIVLGVVLGLVLPLILILFYTLATCCCCRKYGKRIDTTRSLEDSATSGPLVTRAAIPPVLDPSNPTHIEV